MKTDCFASWTSVWKTEWSWRYRKHENTFRSPLQPSLKPETSDLVPKLARTAAGQQCNHWNVPFAPKPLSLMTGQMPHLDQPLPLSTATYRASFLTLSAIFKIAVSDANCLFVHTNKSLGQPPPRWPSRCRFWHSNATSWNSGRPYSLRWSCRLRETHQPREDMNCENSGKAELP